MLQMPASNWVTPAETRRLHASQQSQEPRLCRFLTTASTTSAAFVKHAVCLSCLPTELLHRFSAAVLSSRSSVRLIHQGCNLLDSFSSIAVGTFAEPQSYLETSAYALL